MHFIVCGGRNYTDRELVFRTLDALNKKKGVTLVIQGGAKGADKLGEEWAVVHNCRSSD